MAFSLSVAKELFEYFRRERLRFFDFACPYPALFKDTVNERMECAGFETVVGFGVNGYIGGAPVDAGVGARGLAVTCYCRALESFIVDQVQTAEHVVHVRGYRRERLPLRERVKSVFEFSWSCPAGKMIGARVVHLIILFSSVASILGEEISCKIVDSSSEGIRIR